MDHRSIARASVTRMTRPLIALLAVTALAFAACGGSATPSPSPSGPDLPLEGTTWQLTEYVGASGGVVGVPAGVTVTATFANGTLSGNGGCNTYNAPYTVDGNKLTIGKVQATLMACTGAAGPVEPVYLAILPKVATYSIAGDTLELLNESGTITLRFTGA